MDKDAEISIADGVAHIALDAGPSARLSLAVIQALANAISNLEQDDTVSVIAISGKGKGFPSGITNPSCGGDDQDNQLADVCLQLERCSKPVIAALTGVVAGGGAEIALAAHYRIAHTAARIGFPNARMGLVPNAGATQRLPRLIGAELTFELLLGGQLVPLQSTNMQPLVDTLFDGTTEDAISQFVATLRANDVMPHPTANGRQGFADGQAFQAAIVKARKHVDAISDTAPKHILEAVEAAILLPIEAGLAFEDAAAEDCAATDQAKALAHLFRAEQLVSDQMRRTSLPSVSIIAILGGGPNAAQFAISALDAGLRVNWGITDPTQQRDSVGYVHGLLQDAVLRGKVSEDHARNCRNALNYGDGIQMIEGADIALRAARGQRGISIPPDLPIAHCLPGTDPRLAMQFATSASNSRMVEIILGPNGSEKDRLAAMSYAQTLGTLAILQTTSGLGLRDRLKQAIWRAADSLVDLGQSPYVIDDALQKWGMAQPPFVMADHAGLAFVSPLERGIGCKNWSTLVVEMGREGRAADMGFYRYDDSDAPKPDPDVLHHINEHRAPQTDLPADQIVRLIIGAAANAGAKAMRENVVKRASDIDLVSVFSDLIPRWRGGVMHSVGAAGLLQTQRAMKELGHPNTAFWTPDPIFADLIKNGYRFDDL